MDVIDSIPFPGAEEEGRTCRAAVEAFGRLLGDLELPPVPEGPLSSERLASELALRLRYTPAELQTLLETDSLAARFEALIARMSEWEGRIQFLAPFRPSELDVRRN